MSHTESNEQSATTSSSHSAGRSTVAVHRTMAARCRLEYTRHASLVQRPSARITTAEAPASCSALRPPTRKSYATAAPGAIANQPFRQVPAPVLPCTILTPSRASVHHRRSVQKPALRALALGRIRTAIQPHLLIATIRLITIRSIAVTIRPITVTVGPITVTIRPTSPAVIAVPLLSPHAAALAALASCGNFVHRGIGRARQHKVAPHRERVQVASSAAALEPYRIPPQALRARALRRIRAASIRASARGHSSAYVAPRR